MPNLKKNISDLVSQTQDARSSFNIALSALKNGNLDTAIKKFLQVLEVDSSEDMNRQVLPNLGQAYLLNKQTDLAIAEFRRALKLNPDPAVSAFIHANIGYIYTEQQCYGFAVAEYRQSIKENPKDITSYLTMAMIFENKFRYPEAQEVLEKALKLDPRNTQAKESLDRLGGSTPVVPKEEVVRLVKRLGPLGMIIAMSYDVTYDGYFPMIIYVYPESPLNGKVQPGEKILNVFTSNSVAIEEDDERDILELLESPPGSEVSFQVGDQEINTKCIAPIQRNMEQQERQQVYRQWLQTFDSRLAWLWSAPLVVREQIGPVWGLELESLLMELVPLKHTHMYDFAYALMLEHIQAFSITESGVETEIQYQVNLGRFHYDKVIPDLIQQFSAMQFQYVANLLAART